MNTKTIIDILFVICIAITIITGFDFISYTVKSAPKIATLTKKQWRIGFFSFTVALVIYTLYYK